MKDNNLNPAALRVVRPTDQLAEIYVFYCEALGLSEIGSFDDHDGYNGIMVGVPGKEYHLEFTSHKDGSPCPAPTQDNLLVFYFESKLEVDAIAARLSSHGHEPVKPDNPYWEGKSLTFEDPDGWRVVLFDKNAAEKHA